ncbi:hypothetical protein TNCV_1457001 [Trichonephila clavipes]|nr:hypothetical protein TNCV_1457001 [Trichonephila clavipes]
MLPVRLSGTEMGSEDLTRSNRSSCTTTEEDLKQRVYQCCSKYALSESDENCRLVDAQCCCPGGLLGVSLEIVGSSGHEKVPTRGKPGLELPGRPRGERIEGSCGKHLWTPQ